MTTHNIHDRQASLQPAGVEPQSCGKRNQKPAAADLRLRPRGQWDRLRENCGYIICVEQA